MTTGDELWLYASPRENWEALTGRRGYSVVRDVIPVCCLLTEMN